jgi:8-oxo-dGTP pyrophosphatase MutT (NUDIX family)
MPLIFASLVTALDTALAGTLPGAAAHDLMAARPRREWPGGEQAAARHAAGLVLLFPIADLAHVVLTVRSHRVRHGGQVSLPGGVVEPGETIVEAALREAHEEVGLEAPDLRVLGALTPLDIPVSGFRLHPVVAVLGRQPELRAADDEVARILDVPVHALLAPGAVEMRPVVRGAVQLSAPSFISHDTAIWGATAMILAELLVLLGWTGPKLERS